MATTTTTKRKKKLVYRQDPDGVFRLKKENDTQSIHSESTVEKTEHVDRILNELMECSYKVLDEPEPTPKPKPKPTPAPAPAPAPTKSKPKLNIKTHKLTKDIAPVIHKERSLSPTAHSSHTSSLSSRRSSSKSLDTVLTTPGDASELELKPAEPAQDDEAKTKQETPKPEKKSVFTKARNFASSMKSTAVYLARFHVPSYVLGMATTAVAVRYRVHLVRFVIFAIILGVVGVVAGIGTLILLWYFENLGFLKGYNNGLDKVIGKLQEFDSPRAHASSRESENENIKEKKKDNDKDKTEVETREMVDDEDTEEEEEEEEEEQANFDMLSGVPEEEEDTMSLVETKPEPKEDEKKKARRLSQIRVTPFRYDRRHSEYPTGGSTPNLVGMSANHTSRIPTIKRINTEPLKLHRRSIPSGSSSPEKKVLPVLPMQAEELPFINEVRLVDSYADLEKTGESKHKKSHDESVKRSLSTMSKHSVLRTRENYKRFIANAEDGN